MGRAQQLQAYDGPSEDQSLIPITHTRWLPNSVIPATVDPIPLASVGTSTHVQIAPPCHIYTNRFKKKKTKKHNTLVYRLKPSTDQVLWRLLAKFDPVWRWWLFRTPLQSGINTGMKSLWWTFMDTASLTCLCCDQVQSLLALSPFPDSVHKQPTGVYSFQAQCLFIIHNFLYLS